MSISSLTDPQNAFDWLFKENSSYDVYQNKEDFPILVLTTPRPYSGEALAAVANGAPSVPENAGGQFVFLGRIITGDLPSPHNKLIPDPCDVAIAENTAAVTQLNALHTRFTLFSPSKPAFGVGDLIYGELNADIPENDGGYDLQFARLNRVKMIRSATDSSAPQGCSALAGMFDGAIVFPMSVYGEGSRSGGSVAVGRAAREAAMAANVPEGELNDFYSDIIRGVGGTLNDEVLKFFGAWGNLEQPRTTNNPLATTWPSIGKCTWSGDPGMTTFNTIRGTCGVKNYSTYEAGVQATIKTLNGGKGKYYENIVLFIKGELKDDNGVLVTTAIDALALGKVRVEVDRWGSKGHKVYKRLSEGKTDNPNTLITARGATVPTS